MQNHVFVSKHPVVILQNPVFNPKGTFATCETLFQFQNPLSHAAKPCFNFKTNFCNPRQPFSKPFDPIAALHWPFSKPIRHTRDGDLVEMLRTSGAITHARLVRPDTHAWSANQPSRYSTYTIDILHSLNKG